MKTKNVHLTGNGTYMNISHGVTTIEDVMADECLHFENNGGDLVETNYFDTEVARNGFMYLSWNASVARLLVPDSQILHVQEMKTGQYCVITRGLMVGRDTLEIMFEDGSQAPFVIYIDTAQTNRLVSNHNMPFTVAAWTRTGKVAQWEGKYRVATRLPNMQPWRQP